MATRGAADPSSTGPGSPVVGQDPGCRELFWQAAGDRQSLQSFASRLGRRWLKGQIASRTAFLDSPLLP